MSSCLLDPPRSDLEPPVAWRLSYARFFHPLRAQIQILAAAVVVGMCVVGACVLSIAGEPPGLGDRVVAFCKQHKGKRVGNGECTSLAEAALRAASARRRGWADARRGDRSRRDDELAADYVWGELVYVLERDGTKFKATGQIKDVRPGDIIQFSNVELAGAIDDYSGYTLTAKHHTAIVSGVRDDGMVVNIYHQNSNGRKLVTATSLRLDDLQHGQFRIYHPIPRTRSQPTERPPMSDRPVTPTP